MEAVRTEEIVWEKVYSKDVHLEVELKPTPAGISDVAARVVDINKNFNKGALVVWAALEVDIYFRSRQGSLHFLRAEKPIRYAFFPEKILENMEICLSVSANQRELQLSGDLLGMDFSLEFKIVAVVEKTGLDLQQLNASTEKIVSFRVVDEQTKTGIARGFFEKSGCTAVIAIKPRATGIQARVLKGMVAVEGEIVADIFYHGVSGVEKHSQIEIPFEDIVTCSEAQPGQQARVVTFFNDVMCKPSSRPGCYDVAVGFELKVKVFERTESQVVTDFNREGYKVLKQDLLLRQIIAEGNFSFFRKQDFIVLPPVKSIVDMYSMVKDLRYEFSKEQLIVEGSIGIELFYLGEGSREVYKYIEMGFSENHNIGKLEPGLEFDVRAKIIHLWGESVTGGICINVLVEVDYTGIIRNRIQAVTDIVPREGITRQLFQVDGILETKTFYLMEKNEIHLEYPASYIEDIKGEINNLEVTVLDHRFLIQGELNTHIYYVDCEGAVRCSKAVSPFGVLSEIAGGTKDMQIRVKPQIQDVKATIAGPQLVETAFMLSFDSEASRQQDLYLVTSTSMKTKGGYRRVLTDEKIMQISHLMPLPSPAVFIKDVDIKVEKFWIQQDSPGVWITGNVSIDITYTGKDNLVYQAFDKVGFKFYMDNGKDLDQSRIEFTAKPRKMLVGAGGEMVEGDYDVHIKAHYVHEEVIK